MNDIVREMRVSCPAALFVDVHNLYHTTKTHMKGKIDYALYYQWVKENYDIRYAKAYCSQNASTFKKLLGHIGFDILVDPLCHDYNLILDVLDVAKNVDTIIIGSNAPYVPMLGQRLKALGNKIVIFACAIPEHFATIGERVDIDGILFDEKKTENTVEMK
jgi:hypothetical protein